MSDVPAAEPRMMVELSRLDVKVIRSVLRTVADVDIDWLIVATMRATAPGTATAEDVTANCLVSQIVAKDLLATFAEVLTEMGREDDGH